MKYTGWCQNDFNVQNYTGGVGQRLDGFLAFVAPAALPALQCRFDYFNLDQPTPQVRKTPSWPRSWASFSLL
jgi:hypothetical protein